MFYKISCIFNHMFFIIGSGFPKIQIWAVIMQKRGIFRDVALSHWILRLKIYKCGDFHKKNIKTLTPNEFLEFALVYNYRDPFPHFKNV